MSVCVCACLCDMNRLKNCILLVALHPQLNQNFILNPIHIAYRRIMRLSLSEKSSAYKLIMIITTNIY